MGACHCKEIVGGERRRCDGHDPGGIKYLSDRRHLEQCACDPPGRPHPFYFGQASDLEGRLFPDTYNFFTDTTASSVVNEFTENFNAKAEPLLASDAKNAQQDLILASILEKEVQVPQTNRSSQAYC